MAVAIFLPSIEYPCLLCRLWLLMTAMQRSYIPTLCQGKIPRPSSFIFLKRNILPKAQSDTIATARSCISQHQGRPYLIHTSLPIGPYSPALMILPSRSHNSLSRVRLRGTVHRSLLTSSLQIHPHQLQRIDLQCPRMTIKHRAWR